MELAGKDTEVFRTLGFQKCFRLQEFHLANVFRSEMDLAQENLF